MSEQDGTQAPALQRPTNDDKKAWKAYWKTQGQPWRTEPEIDVERQKYLAERCSITPDAWQGIYPFKGIKLSRADVEWLLATHENGCGSVDWSDENQRKRKGLDLRGAILNHENLNGLPLTCMLGGAVDYNVTMEQRTMAAIHLERATLRGTQLEGSYLIRANLEGAFLPEARLEEANLYEAHLEGANLREAHLGGANLSRAFFNTATNLNGTFFSNTNGKSIRLAGIHWGDVDLSMVDWSLVRILGDERRARQRERPDGQPKNRNKRLREYKEAVRANRQLAVVLRDQGLNEEADRFAYRAQLLQRVVWRLQRRPLKFVLSWFLYLLAGYGYRPLRSILIYLLVVLGFAVGYYQGWSYYHLEHITKHSLSYVGAVIFSITAFHGRGFFLGGELGYDSLITILGAIEAVIGLIIELSFIATFTQRFFGK